TILVSDWSSDVCSSDLLDNLDRGFSFTKGVNVMGYGGTNTLSVEKQAGTIAGTGSGTEHIVATDSSREKRESLSHTTNLSQLYRSEERRVGREGEERGE